MKANQLSRLQLLQWLNEFAECDYQRVEQCCDGIGFAQVLDALHPNTINLVKLNYNSKFADEYSLNLKILDDSLKKLRIEKIVQIDKLSKGKFSDNMNFLQWLYNYSQNLAPLASKNYNGYEKRLNALNKQTSNRNPTMNSHLIPNNAFQNFKPQKLGDQPFNEQDYDQGIEEQPIQMMQSIPQQIYQQNPSSQSNQFQNLNSVGQVDTKTNKRLQYLDEYIKELEMDLKTKMEYNWKILYALDDMIYQRNTLYNILCDIETLCNKFKPSQSKHTVLNILGNTPSDFQPETNIQQ